MPDNGGIAFGMPNQGIAFGMPGQPVYPAQRPTKRIKCRACVGTDCLGGYSLDDLDLYNIQGDPFLWVSQCPPGYSCQPNPTGGTICYAACDEQLCADYPANVTTEEYNQILAQLIAEAAARLPFCSQQTPPTQPPNQPPTGPPVVLYFNQPQSCTVKCPRDQSPFTYTVPAGRFLSGSIIEANKAARARACQLAQDNMICFIDSIPQLFCQGTAFSKTVQATGAFLLGSIGSGSLSQFVYWSTGGTLPPGLTVSPTGFSTQAYVTISGTPTTVGSYTFSVTMMDASGNSMTKSYTICIVGQTSNPPGIDDTHLPDATVNTGYVINLNAPTCATPPLSWQVAAGSKLPDGLTLEEGTGILSGIPTTPGTYTFTLLLQTQAT